MKKIISLLSLILVLTTLAYIFVGCAPQSTMLDMAKAVVDGKVDKALIDIENIQGTMNADGYYDISGYSDYTASVYKIEAGAGGYIGAKHSAHLRQSTEETVIAAGTEENNYYDYSKYSLKTFLKWSFDDVDESGDYIHGYIEYRTINMANTQDQYFHVEYTLYEIEPFTENVDSNDAFFSADDLKSIKITYYNGIEGDYGWDDLTAEDQILFLTTINTDLARLVKTCTDAGYPPESR